MTIGKLKSVELRETWSQGEKDFTNWLSNNLDILGEAIGLELEEPETECPLESSNFKVDIVAKTIEGKNIIIENQLDPTDHKHLGQIMTYMINKKAKIAIWISKQVRKEYIKVIEWLNEYTDTDKDFYLVQLESYKIDNSKPAPYFKVICKPNSKMKDLEKEGNEKAQLIMKFWKSLKDASQKKAPFFRSSFSAYTTRITSPIPKTNIELAYRINKEKAGIAILFEEHLKDHFQNCQKAWENKLGFGFKLEKVTATPEKYQFVKWFNKGGYQSSESEWEQIQKEMIENMIKLEKLVKANLNNLKPFKEVA